MFIGPEKSPRPIYEAAEEHSSLRHRSAMSQWIGVSSGPERLKYPGQRLSVARTIAPIRLDLDGFAAIRSQIRAQTALTSRRSGHRRATDDGAVMRAPYVNRSP